MLNLERALKQDRLLRALTGLNRQAFDALLPSFEQAYEASRIAAKPERQRAMGGGRKARLESPEAKLFYILFYFKCYPTFDLAGILFDLDRSQTHEWMHGLQPILEVALGEKMVLPARKLRSVEAFVEAFPGVERVMIDATERPMQRPQAAEQHSLNYSGKKRRHKRSHLAAVDQRKRVLVLSKPREGKLHDKKFHHEEDIAGSIPDQIPIELYLGFLGVDKQYDNIHIPHKKPKGGELTQAHKADNRRLSHSRVVCENAFAGMKRYGAVCAVSCNLIEEFDHRLMFTAAG